MNNYERIKAMTLDEMVKMNFYAYSDCLIKIFSGKETGTLFGTVKVEWILEEDNQ